MESLQQVFMPLPVLSVWIILVIITDILIISYLGPMWDSKQTIDPTDWRRKWILFFAWFKLASFALMLFFTFGTILFVPILNIFLSIWIIFNILIIRSLGPLFSNDPIEMYDWEKKFILFISWFYIALIAISLISVFMSNIYVPSKKYQMWERPDLFHKRPIYGPQNQYGPFLPPV